MELATKSADPKLPEPWLRGTLPEVRAVLRAVLHALHLAGEDMNRFCAGLTTEELHTRPFGIPSVAFHIRHIARSIDRLLTYAEGRPLSQQQTAALKREPDEDSPKEDLLSELERAFTEGEARIRKLDVATLEDVRTVGRKRLPTTVAGLLIHVADHTQRHVGQAVTTSRIVLAQRSDRGFDARA